MSAELGEVEREIREKYVECKSFSVDVTDRQWLKQVFAGSLEYCGKIDIQVNGALVCNKTAILEISDMREEMRMDESILQKAYDLGYEFEKTYHGCAQCVIGAVSTLFPELRNDDIFRAASAQGGGMGLSSKGQCGATLGAGMLFSQLYGRTRENIEDPERKRDVAHRMALEFLDRFIEEMGSLICGDIQEKKMGRRFNLFDPDDREEFLKLGGHDTHCPDVVATATRIVVEILLKDKEKESA